MEVIGVITWVGAPSLELSSRGSMRWTRDRPTPDGTGYPALSQPRNSPSLIRMLPGFFREKRAYFPLFKAKMSRKAYSYTRKNSLPLCDLYMTAPVSNNAEYLRSMPGRQRRVTSILDNVIVFETSHHWLFPRGIADIRTTSPNPRRPGLGVDVFVCMLPFHLFWRPVYDYPRRTSRDHTGGM